MQFTQQEMLKQLKASGRKRWKLRQMTALREEGYLPPLLRQTQPGTNKPRYVWDQTHLEQICVVYDFWEHYQGDRATLTLALWLQEYAVPIDPLRRMYLQHLDEYLEKLTHGETDPDDILFEVSHVAFAVIRKFRYTPSLTKQRQKLNLKDIEPVIESIFGALAIPAPEMIDNVSRSFASSANFIEDDSMDDVEEVLNTPKQVTLVLQDILALPNLRTVVQEATLEQWEQARKDCLIFCQLISEWGKVSGIPTLPDWQCRNLMMYAVCWLIVPLLSTQYRGHGQWIDLAFEKIHEALIDPSLQTKVRASMRERKGQKSR